MVTIPAGEFWMGTSYRQIEYMLDHEAWADDWHDQEMFQGEQPYHKVDLPAYEIARCPVTNFEYHIFVWESGYKAPKTWIGFHYIEEEAFYPVSGISREDALAYCEWLQKALIKATGEEPANFKYRLPTEAEWERAARGEDDRIYPWGNDFDPWRCNTADSRLGGASQVCCYSPSGDSPFGVADMAGNVWELTNSILRPYPYKPDDGARNPAFRTFAPFVAAPGITAISWPAAPRARACCAGSPRRRSASGWRGLCRKQPRRAARRRSAVRSCTDPNFNPRSSVFS